MIDGHIHLENGPLTVEYVLEFVEEARKKGIDTLQILDHTHRFKEFSFLYPAIIAGDKKQEAWLSNKLKDSMDDYVQLIEDVKKLDLDIEIRFGLEVCYRPDCKDQLREVLSHYSLDFIVGAIHSIDGLLYDMPFSPEILWDKYPTNDIYQRYYALVLDLVESDLFTQLAHPDTIKLFTQYQPTYDLIPTYEELSKALIKHHMKAENNTGCHYRYNHPDVGLSDTLLQVFTKNNVPIITASDAHYPKHVGMCFDQIKK